MTDKDRMRAELEVVGRALEARTADIRAFSAEFFPKLTAVKTTGEGQAALVSVLVKQIVGPFYHALPSADARDRLVEVLEEMAAQIRSAPMAKPN